MHRLAVSAELAFPILTFDEQRLSPALGYVFHRRWLEPYESIVSILWKFAKANALPGYRLASQLAVTQVDPYEGIPVVRSAIDLRRLSRTLRIPAKPLRAAVIPAFGHGVSSPYFRYCTTCLSRAYHSVVHQFENVYLCPIHQRGLAVQCRCCSYSAPYRLDARLLGAPYRCARCGFRYWASPVPSIAHQRKLSDKERVAVARRRNQHSYS